MITSLKGFEETVSSRERDQCGRPDGSPGEGSLGPGQAAPRSGTTPSCPLLPAYQITGVPFTSCKHRVRYNQGHFQYRCSLKT